MSNPVQSRKASAPDENRTLIDELVSIAATGDVKQRLRVIKRVADLFMIGSRGYTDAQIALFDDVLRELAIDIEVKARASLANQFAVLDRAPPKLIRLFAFDDEIEVAAPVLTHSKQLSDAELVKTANTKSQQHLLAIAQRLKLSEVVTDVLVDRGDQDVVRKVAKNKGAAISLAGYGKLTHRARADRELTLTLGRRSDIPRHYFLKLLETASASVRVKLEAANPQAIAAIRGAIDEAASEMQREARNASREHAAAARDAGLREYAQPIKEANVHAFAVAQKFEKTVLALAKFGRFPIGLVERALVDPDVDAVLILAKAASCSWITVRALLLMNSANRHLNADQLSLVSGKYRSLLPETAHNAVEFYRQRILSRAEEKADAGNVKLSVLKDAADEPSQTAAPQPGDPLSALAISA